MDVSAAASGKDAGKNKPPAPPGAHGVAICAVTALFAWQTLRTLRGPDAGAIDEDQAFRDVLLRLSPLVCAYLFFLTIALSGAASAVAALVRASSLPPLAAAAGKIISPHAGAALMFLATVYSAATSGSALAERRQRAGTERAAPAAAAAAPSYQSREESLEERRCRAAVVSCSVFAAAAISAAMALVLWLTPEEDGDDPRERDVVGLGCLVSLAGPWLAVSGQLLLNGSPLQVGGVTLELVMPLGFIGWFLAAVLAGVFVDMVAAVCVLWAGALGMAGFFGYGLAVEAHYKQLLDIKRRKPRTAMDASGLLDGRDKEDACSAHIDAATGRCHECALLGPSSSRCTC